VRLIPQALFGLITVLIIVAHDFEEQIKIHGFGYDQIGKVVVIQFLFNVLRRVSRDKNNRYI